MNEIKKILLVSKFSNNPNIYTYATSFHNALQKLGYLVETFNCKNNFFTILGSTGHNELHPKLKIINNYFCNINLKKTVANFKPDLIFLIKAENISYKTLRTIKNQTNCKLINFYPDNPFVFWNGNSNQNILLSLPLYDHFLIWSKTLVPILEMAGCKSALYFPLAYDEDIFNQKVTLTSEDKKQYISDVCFAGTWDAQREWWLTQICKKMPTLDLSIWGNLWNENLAANSILRMYLRGNAIYNTKMIKAFNCSKIVLNFIRKQNLFAHNMRTFEALASGVFMLTQRTKEQTEPPFVEGKNIECFDSTEELAKKIVFYINEDTLRKDIAKKGFELSAGFGITKQLKNLLNAITKGDENEKKQKTKNRNSVDTQQL